MSRNGGGGSKLKRKAAKRKPTPTRGRTAPPASADASFPIVGIGASAGGLEAMTLLLKHLPSRTGMAFVLVQHLDPTHESALTFLLSRLTEMPVSEAKHNLPLERDQVYVIPPNKMMGISGRQLKLSPRSGSTESHLPIDEFFRTLAEEEGNRAIGVVLSGNGSDGTQGLQAIKAAGGITFAQEEKSAKYATMPGNAITAGCVDFVLPPERIGRELARVAGHPYVAPMRSDEEAGKEPPAEEQAFAAILGLLRQRVGVDFSEYKRPTLQRRIQRRMLLHKCDSLKQYLGHLRSHPAEVTSLFGDILIHVTGFFRDAAVFQRLKRKVFPRIVKGKGANDPIRVWVPGCSTGEEVYSLAIALTEFMDERRMRHPVQVFGTDIHDGGLETARTGLYPEHIRADVSAERLRRFFVKTQEGYRINKGIREMCIFARQNLATDPPFSNLDLISCRNVLIYLGASLQRKVFPLFHYALKPNAFLMLGASEAVGGYADLFGLADKHVKLYVKKTTHLRPSVNFGPGVHLLPAEPGRGSPVVVGPPVGDVQKQADRVLLSHHSPPGVVINQNLEVLQFRGRTAPYLEHAHGEASLNLLKMARESLMLDLRTAIHKAMKENARVRKAGLVMKQNGHSLELAVEIIPFTVPPSTERFYLVLFEPPAAVPGAAAPERRGRRRAAGARSVETAEVARLREELGVTRESLQAIIEGQDATNEELRSANEEILSSNEELQSTNEELETAKEELQSTNEELTTLNDELESRNSEMEHVNNDLHNVLGSVNIPIILLGSDLRIRRFTNIAEKSFNLIPGDVGRPITDINLPLNIPELPKLVMEVIDTLTTRELELKGRDNRWWSVRIRPYKTTDNKIEGAVMVMVDIDLVKTAAHQLSQGRALAQAVIDEVQRPVLVLDQDLSIQAANQAFYEAFQTGAEATLNRRIYELRDGEWNIPRLRTLLEAVLPESSSFTDFEVARPSSQAGRRTMKLEARHFGLKGEKPNLILLTFGEAGGKDGS